MKNLSFLVVLFAFFACKEDNTTANYVDFTMTLTGKNMAPATASAARGTVVAKYYRATRVLTYTITYEGLTPNAWHIHKGAVGVTGAVVFNLGTSFTTPFTATTAALTTDQEKDLLAGNYYVDIHSALYANGEIRGQLTPESN
ncbi:MAG: CHRD domain-containing protein [Spirosomataceae bacterium]